MWFFFYYDSLIVIREKGGYVKRVWCLYRVSSKKQVNTDDDIPMQRNACREFVKRKENWQITNELYERGISGWSKKADERDEMNVIREGALKKEFDLLLVFMYDRLGRREDETPFIVQFLIEQGIEVWSVNEGQAKIEDHSDILINFIRFWQSAGESKKTSIRVREAKKQLSEQGYFQGGEAPTGYKIIETDQIHWKNKAKRIKKLIVHDPDAELIKLIFRLYIDRQMGYRKIVDYLYMNGYRNQKGKGYGISTIQRILQNPLYIGRKRYKSFDGEMTEQPYDEALRIISDDIFYQAQEIRKQKREKLKDQDKQGIPLAGKLMFSGLAYCKYCGARLSGNYLYRNTKYYEKEGNYKSVVYRYRCPLNKGKHDCNHERNMWGAKKYDKLIIQQVKMVLHQLDIKLFIDHSVMNKAIIRKQKEENLRNLEKESQKLKKQLEKLNAEIAKTLLGESEFTPHQLSNAMDQTNQRIAEGQYNMKTIMREIEDARADDSDVNYPANERARWEGKFDQCDPHLKKALLSRIIDKVYFAKNEIEIEFNIMIQDIIKRI